MSHPVPCNVPLPVDGVKVVVLADAGDVVVGIVVVGVGLLVQLAVGRQLGHGPGVRDVQKVVVTRVARVPISKTTQVIYMQPIKKVANVAKMKLVVEFCSDAPDKFNKSATSRCFITKYQYRYLQLSQGQEINQEIVITRGSN